MMLLGASSEGCCSWPSTEGARAGEVCRLRTLEVDARGVRWSDCECGGGAVLPLREGKRASSRLPFRSSGKREKVRRRAWTLVRAGAGGVVDGAGSACETMLSVCSCSSTRARCWTRGPVLLGWSPSRKTARGAEGVEEIGTATVRGTNGVVKGIAVKGRMITENSLRPHERQHVGTLPGLAVQSATQSLGSPGPLSLLPPASTTPPSQDS